MTADFTEADMAVLRKEGFRGQVMRDLIAEGAARKTPTAAVPVPRQPGRTAGAWPPPSTAASVPDQPPDAWAAALDEYRAWVTAGCPPGQYRCECPAHQPADGGTR